MDRGAWRATAQGGHKRVGHDLATKPKETRKHLIFIGGYDGYCGVESGWFPDHQGPSTSPSGIWIICVWNLNPCLVFQLPQEWSRPSSLTLTCFPQTPWGCITRTFATMHGPAPCCLIFADTYYLHSNFPDLMLHWSTTLPESSLSSQEVNGLWGGYVSPWAGPGASSVLQASINLGLSILPITAGGIQSISSTWTTWTPIIHYAPGTPGPQRLWTHHQPAPRSPSGGLSAEAAPPA